MSEFRQKHLHSDKSTNPPFEELLERVTCCGVDGAVDRKLETKMTESMLTSLTFD